MPTEACAAQLLSSGGRTVRRADNENVLLIRKPQQLVDYCLFRTSYVQCFKVFLFDNKTERRQSNTSKHLAGSFASSSTSQPQKKHTASINEGNSVDDGQIKYPRSGL